MNQLHNTLRAMPTLEAIVACQTLERITGDDYYDIMQSLMHSLFASDITEALAWCDLVTVPDSFQPTPRYLLGIGVN